MSIRKPRALDIRTGGRTPALTYGKASMAALAHPVVDRPSTAVQRARTLPFPLLDELRAVAALTVLAGYIYLLGFRIPADRPLDFAGRFLLAEAFGVPLFFLLSGFLLYGQFARAAQRGRTVARARFW